MVGVVGRYLAGQIGGVVALWPAGVPALLDAHVA